MTITSLKKALKERNLLVFMIAIIFAITLKGDKGAGEEGLIGLGANTAYANDGSSSSDGGGGSDGAGGGGGPDGGAGGAGGTGGGADGAPGAAPGDSGAGAGAGGDGSYTPPTEPVVVCNDDGVRTSRETNYPSSQGWILEGENKAKRASVNQYSVVRYGRDANNCLVIQGREDAGIDVSITR